MQANAFFPTVVWSSSVDGFNEINDSLIKSVYKLRSEEPEGVSFSNVSGWQSSASISDKEEFSLLMKEIAAACNEVAASEHFNSELKYFIAAWANINPPGSCNHTHLHGGSLLSGVYYIKSEGEKSGNLVLKDPRTASLMIQYPCSQLSEFTRTSVSITPTQGNIHIFPSWLEHGVEANQGVEDRISVAFNFYPVI